ncbi:MAG: mandelate racemase/muconate lactonizing enzyme family protein, partial [Paracoccaceae bacterium]
YNATFGPDLCCTMAEEMFARQFEGCDPHHIEKLWRKSYGAGYTLRPDVTVMGVLSGLEMACWDIIGKAADQPVYQLLGGKVHDRLRSYTYLYPPAGDVYPDPNMPNVYNDADHAAEAAVRAVAQGFTAVKFDPAGPYSIYDGHQPRLMDLDLSERFCKTIRDAVGTRADLLFGTHGQFTVSGAKRMARRLEAYDPLWFEEPIPPENPNDMAEVARFTSIPIATGERLCTKHEFARLLESGAASILQMNLGRVGGLLEAKKIAAMAETRQAQIAPHLYCGPVVAAANIQIATCSPNFLILESIGRFDGPFMSFLTTPIVWEDGYVIPPTAPGLGIELNDAALKAHPYHGSDLHLNLVNDPVLPPA